jgi:hypothetical protein
VIVWMHKHGYCMEGGCFDRYPLFRCTFCKKCIKLPKPLTYPNILPFSINCHFGNPGTHKHLTAADIDCLEAAVIFLGIFFLLLLLHLLLPLLLLSSSSFLCGWPNNELASERNTGPTSEHWRSWTADDLTKVGNICECAQDWTNTISS